MDIKNLLKVSRPLQIIALMIGLSEIGLGMVSNNVSLDGVVIWVMILLPFLLLLFFFTTLFFRPNNLYGPGDFSDPKDFLLLQGKVQALEESLFIKYAELEEPAIRLFLSSYRKGAESVDVNYQRLIEKFGRDSMDKALNKLEKMNWLSKNNKKYEKTKEGTKSYSILKEFVIGRLG
ncbi:MAG: hypothetical protein KAS07_03440 [Candidatus Pacebacteria bacterium]|nr:hypothetical protein [Candidatus Paceibacterota bacterium]